MISSHCRHFNQSMRISILHQPQRISIIYSITFLSKNLASNCRMLPMPHIRTVRDRDTPMSMSCSCVGTKRIRNSLSIEVSELQSLFENMYDFDVQVWKIPSQNSHNQLNPKILDFFALDGDCKDHLKIVYYGGHGMLAHNRQASWASRPDPKIHATER
ncbi:hypothetical protein BKA65DRAFT_487731 [Rhexocercosporidium sp. MPI-PUGE-AT-0058]|nr:hypothetical protein BKA65DRAFT_487731 [Rhexocercosporidium sp. MPI-PUGE-AT-0058]